MVGRFGAAGRLAGIGAVAGSGRQAGTLEHGPAHRRARG